VAVRTSSTVTPCSAATVSEFSPALIMLATSTMRAPLLTNKHPRFGKRDERH
jgi:hypothetical protein